MKATQPDPMEKIPLTHRYADHGRTERNRAVSTSASFIHSFIHSLLIKLMLSISGEAAQRRLQSEP